MKNNDRIILEVYTLNSITNELFLNHMYIVHTWITYVSTCSYYYKI